jgi:DHA1 family bicyclomycin/chloramphenicol resistance-like MFS transporter
MLRPDSWGFTILLGALTAMTALAVDMSLPSLPTLAQVFSATPDRVQLTLSLFMVGYAGGQLVCGPLSDRFGRRRMLLVGLTVYTLAGLACAASPRLDILVVARLIQGFGACVGPILGRAVVRDRMTGARAAQTLSYITITMSLGPMVAPLIGGFLLSRFGWQAIFLTLGTIGLALGIATFLGFAESLREPDPHALKPARLMQNAASFFTSRRTIGFAVVNAFTFSGLFAFLSGLPYVLIEIYGVPADVFGFYFALNAMGLAAGAFANGRLVHRFRGETVMRGAFVLQLAAAAGLLLVGWTGAGGAIGIMLPIMTYMIALAMILPNGTAAAMEPLPHMAGMAASLMGAIQMGSGSLSGLIVAALYSGTPMAMAGAIAVAAIGTVLSYLLLVRGRGAG